MIENNCAGKKRIKLHDLLNFRSHLGVSELNKMCCRWKISMGFPLTFRSPNRPILVDAAWAGIQRPRYLQDQGFPAGPVLVSYLGLGLSWGLQSLNIRNEHVKHVTFFCPQSGEVWSTSVDFLTSESSSMTKPVISASIRRFGSCLR